MRTIIFFRRIAGPGLLFKAYVILILCPDPTAKPLAAPSDIPHLRAE
jgi:hypothetical protein